ncbi:MAG: DUF2703 domain-containing protein [Dehalococcoidia bacterium]
MKIEFLYFDDCPNHHAARQLLGDVLREQGVEGTIEAVAVTDSAVAERVRFAGSPTIRIDGRDVEPGFIDTGDHTLRCRVYQTSRGLRGVPEREWIAAAVEAARQ